MGNFEIAVLNEIEKRNDFIQLRNNIEQALQESKSVMVFGEEQVDKAGFYIKNLRQLRKRLEDHKKTILQPIKADIKTAEKFYKSINDEVEIEEKRLVLEVEDFLREKKEREEEQKRQEQKEMEDDIIREAEVFDDESVLDHIPQIEIKTTGLGQISSNITTMRIKRWRVSDFDKIDRKYLIVDEQLMTRLRKEADFDAVSDIEGIEFFTEETIRTK